MTDPASASPAGAAPLPRRDFLAALAAGAAAAPLAPIAGWPGKVFRRSSVDIHVPDRDPALPSRFDAEDLVETLARGGVQSHLRYTNSHVGLCLRPTKVGKPHGALKGLC